jgi:hypothetical protein
MKYIILFSLVFILSGTPATAHGFGLFKYIWDGFNNQLGLDRGPIPKVIPKRAVLPCNDNVTKRPLHAYAPTFHLQAEGF